MNINNIPALSQYQNALNALGFSDDDSFEQLRGAAEMAAPELAAYLRVPMSELVSMINTSAGSASSVPQSALDIINQATYSLGVELSQIPFLTIAPSISEPISPLEAVNLIPNMPPIRNQKTRGTCVAHAALSAYEHFLTMNGSFQDLSEQFLYWNCKRNDGIPNQAGTWLRVAFDLLDLEGCCLETTWPYEPNPIAGNEGQNPPPGGAQLDAMSFRNRNRSKSISPTSVGDIKNELTAGRCVAFSIPVFNSWHRSTWVANTGDITMPVPNEIITGGHAMCFVGYFDTTFPGLGGGRFIVRNSWGDTWGINSSFGAGYGTIPYAYIDRMGMEAFVLS